MDRSVSVKCCVWKWRHNINNMATKKIMEKKNDDFDVLLTYITN